MIIIKKRIKKIKEKSSTNKIIRIVYYGHLRFKEEGDCRTFDFFTYDYKVKKRAEQELERFISKKLKENVNNKTN